MTKIKPLLLIISLLISPTIARAEIKYLNWNENITITDSGKNTAVEMRGRVANLSRKSYQSAFSFIFAPNQKIKITSALLDQRPAKYTFQDNQLTIRLGNSKVNNEYLTLAFTYEEIYDQIYHDLRQEAIYVPAWVAGSVANITFDFPESMDIATYDPYLKKVNNKIIYEGEVPKDGITKIIKLTPSKKIWNVTIKNSVSSDKILNDLQISVPVHFKNSGQKNYHYQTYSSPMEQRFENKSENDIFYYKNTGTNKIEIKTGATIYTGKDYRLNISRSPSSYLEVKDQDRPALTRMLQQIRSASNPDNLPRYTQIGHYVHNFIHYDIAYAGKKLKVPEIIAGQTGVCAEYATLFNALARAAGIPSIVVNGAARGEYGKFEAHSWNLIFYENRWIYVDPTWDLMSGVVSASHIYFYDGDTKSLSAQGFSNWGNIKMDTSFEIEEKL